MVRQTGLARPSVYLLYCKKQAVYAKKRAFDRFLTGFYRKNALRCRKESIDMGGILGLFSAVGAAEGKNGAAL